MRGLFCKHFLHHQVEVAHSIRLLNLEKRLIISWSCDIYKYFCIGETCDLNFGKKLHFWTKKHASVQKLIFIQKVNVGTLKRLPTSLVCAFLFLWVIRQSEQRNYWDASLHLDSRIPDSWMKSLLSTEMCLQQVRMEESRTVHVGERLCGERKIVRRERRRRRRC